MMQLMILITVRSWLLSRLSSNSGLEILIKPLRHFAWEVSVYMDISKSGEYYIVNYYNLNYNKVKYKY